MRSDREVLLLDCGNSRLKWARAQLPYERGQAFAASGSLELPTARSARSLRMLLEQHDLATNLFVSNVAGPAVQRAIERAARPQALAVQFVATSAAAAGVRNGYAQPWRLGVDRWVALIGAHHEHPGTALCIVGAGSAMTIDLLSASGAHQGGCIVPGPRMMIESLLQNTAGIRQRAQLPDPAALTRALAQALPRAARARSLFAHDTRNALLSGAHFACAGIIELALGAAAERLGATVQLILTGGAAEPIGSLLRVPFRYSDDLVLRGLAVLAGLRRGR
jgi:type III pantothenate kinase